MVITMFNGSRPSINGRPAGDFRSFGERRGAPRRTSPGPRPEALSIVNPGRTPVEYTGVSS